jgi:hypothetical protein
MNQDDIYATPKSNLTSEKDVKDVDEPRALSKYQIYRLIKGQKLIINSIIVFVLTFTLLFGFEIFNVPLDPDIVNPVSYIAIIIAVILGIVGYFYVSLGVNVKTLAILFFSVGLFVPLMNLIILAAINNRATIALRKAGYKVGVFGVKL